ncbi:MAG: phosphate transport system substrate-binding protein [Actinobacteria bacterium]|jgi:phosphate transport system substrate-binding protein|nr:phosphate transport system substrate-binding protein [Actinomycetota bacterium]
MKFSTKAKAVALAALIVVSTAQPAHAVDLTGSGASFVDPLLQACKAGFAKASGHSYVYSSVGSGTGKRNSDSQLGDFWFSDSTHSASTKRSTVFHAPIIAAPIAVLVNLPAKKDIYLSTATVAKIFAGEITKWNDAAIVADNNRSITTTIYRKDSNGNVKKDSKGNPVVLRTATKTSYYTLPNQLIKVVFRADGSGTTNNFTKWLNGVAPTVWTKPANDAFTTAFPSNINAPANIGRIVGANASQGIATLAAKTPYSITYAEKNWGDAYGLRAAYVSNATGQFVYPDSAAVSAFLGEANQDANGIVTYDYSTKVAGAYTLGIVSYMLVETSYADKAKGAAVKQLAEYILSSECAAGDPKLGYVVLTGSFLDKAKSLIAKMNK